MYFRNYHTGKTRLDNSFKNSRLGGLLERQHDKRGETLIQSSRQSFYHID